jgi:hypothetical protein
VNNLNFVALFRQNDKLLVVKPTSPWLVITRKLITPILDTSTRESFCCTHDAIIKNKIAIVQYQKGIVFLISPYYI